MSPDFASIEEASQHELQAILAYLADRSEGDHPPVLVGGWAVFSYNPWVKSQDIDLVLSSSDRSSLQWWLRQERGFEPRRAHRQGWHGARKHLPDLGPIVVDIGTYSKTQTFEGRDEALDFDLALDQNVQRRVAGSLVRVPSRSLLTLYKAKAAWDRRWRLEHDVSPDPDRERGKLVKDRADILALTDPALDAPWDLAFLSEQLQRLGFLADVLREAPESDAGIERYGKVSRGEAREAMERVLRQAGVGGA